MTDLPHDQTLDDLAAEESAKEAFASDAIDSAWEDPSGLGRTMPTDGDMGLGPRAVIVCASHKGLSADTKRSVDASGYPLHLIVGVSDTALARNLCLTAALDWDVDVVLMMDDDMQVIREASRKLVQLAHEHQLPVSALYMTGDGRAAAWQSHQGDSWQTSRWLTGLGALAIPMAMLRSLAERSEVVVGDKLDVVAFTWSGVGRLPLIEDPRPRWISEDYRLTERLGGCLLPPIAAGHQKMVALMPDEVALEALKGGRLPEAPTAVPTIPEGVNEGLRGPEPTTRRERVDPPPFHANFHGVREEQPEQLVPTVNVPHPSGT